MKHFRVPGMTCGGCAAAISRAIAAVDRDARVQVDVARKLVAVEGSLSDDQLIAAIRQAGYEPEAAGTAPAASSASGCCCGARARAAPGRCGAAQAAR